MAVGVDSWGSKELCVRYIHMQGESKKVTLLRLWHIFPLVAIFHRQKITQLFAIHILTYVSILVHLFQYLSELQHFFCNINPRILTVYFSNSYVSDIVQNSIQQLTQRPQVTCSSSSQL